MIDNYDSFTYNLVQYLGELGADVTVTRNDARDRRRDRGARPDALVISPGPGTPDEAGITPGRHRATSRRAAADPRRLPRPPGHRPGVRRRGAPRRRSCTARPRPDPPRRRGALRRPAGPLHGHALPLAGGRPRRCPSASRSRPGPTDGVVMGAAAPRAAGRGRAVPPREHPHRARGCDLLRNFLRTIGAESGAAVAEEARACPMTCCSAALERARRRARPDARRTRAACCSDHGRPAPASPDRRPSWARCASRARPPTRSSASRAPCASSPRRSRWTPT